MAKSFIYTDFFDHVIWLKNQVNRDYDSIAPELKTLANHYLTERLRIISKRGGIAEDPELGRPVPYAVFWFADALGYRDVDTIRRLVLALTYSAVVTTIRDDVLDDTIASSDEHEKLADYFSKRSLAVFNRLFDNDPTFWDVHKACEREFETYADWRLASLNMAKVEPLSNSYLWNSSRYFSAVVLPSLAALCILSGKAEKIQDVAKFLKHFSVGWRLFDDLNDWRLDIRSAGYNRSSVLLYMEKEARGLPVTESMVESYLLDKVFINRVCGAMIDNFSRAKQFASTVSSRYLERFMDEQISFHSRRRDYLLARSQGFTSDLSKILSDLG